MQATAIRLTNTAQAVFMEWRKSRAELYRYGFGGQEKDNEIYGDGASYTAEFWQYDARLGRRWNVEPLASEFPWISTYACFANNPISFIDPDGKTPWPALIIGRYYPARSGDNAFSQNRIHPVKKTLHPHKGIDLGYHPIHGRLQGGESVLAAAEGVVSFVSKEESKTAGYYIKIDHGGGYQTSYMHLQEKPNFKKGDLIKNEQEIGKVGSTGLSTGNHLHFEISKGGKQIDPTSIYDLQELINPDNVGTRGYGMENHPIRLEPVEVKSVNNEINGSTN